MAAAARPGYYGGRDMGWDRKGSCGLYYYKSVREGDRVRKVYLGRGPRAEAEAGQVEARRQARQAERATCRQDVAKVAAAEQALRDLKTLAGQLVQAALEGAGFHQHRGQWRRRRHARDGDVDDNGYCTGRPAAQNGRQIQEGEGGPSDSR
jgi:hypothetical protein